MNKFALTAGLALALAAAAGVWYYGPFHDDGTLRFPGIVEVQEVRLGSKVGGRVARVLVEEGRTASPGQELVMFEVPELEDRRAQLQAQLAAAEAELLKAVNGPRPEEKEAAEQTARAARARHDRLVKGWREEEKRQAAGELAGAEAQLKQAGEELARVARLWQERSASKADHELAVAARDRARAQADAARAKLDMLQSGSRKEDVDEAYAEWQKARAKVEELRNGTRAEDKELARAKVKEAAARLREVETNLKEAVVRVPAELGRVAVEVVAVRPGDLVPANQPVVRVLRTDDLWVKVFVPETQLGLLAENTEVTVTIDSYPGKQFRGVVAQRANVSEFTPRNVQSVDERRYQMFAVKVRVDDPQGVFNAGMAAEVVLSPR